MTPSSHNPTSVGFKPHSPTGGTPSDPGYVYHATNEENAYDIAGGHLEPHDPWHGTDQSTWPDGSTEKRSYWSRNAGAVHSFAPEEGKSVILRTRHADHFKPERHTGDIVTTKKVHSDDIDIRHENGSWHPLNRVYGMSKAFEMLKAQEGEEGGEFRGGDPEELQEKREAKREEAAESGDLEEQEEEAAEAEEEFDPEEAAELAEEEEAEKAMIVPGQPVYASEVVPVDNPPADYVPRNFNGDPYETQPPPKKIDQPVRTEKNRDKKWSEVTGMNTTLQGEPWVHLRQYTVTGDHKGAAEEREKMYRSLNHGLLFKAVLHKADLFGKPRAHHKYISRKWEGGEWVYEYSDEKHNNHGIQHYGNKQGHSFDIPEHVDTTVTPPQEAFDATVEHNLHEGGVHELMLTNPQTGADEKKHVMILGRKTGKRPQKPIAIFDDQSLREQHELGPDENIDWSKVKMSHATAGRGHKKIRNLDNLEGIIRRSKVNTELGADKTPWLQWRHGKGDKISIRTHPDSPFHRPPGKKASSGGWEHDQIANVDALRDFLLKEHGKQRQLLGTAKSDHAPVPGRPGVTAVQSGLPKRGVDRVPRTAYKPGTEAGPAVQPGEISEAYTRPKQVLEVDWENAPVKKDQLMNQLVGSGMKKDGRTVKKGELEPLIYSAAMRLLNAHNATRIGRGQEPIEKKGYGVTLQMLAGMGKMGVARALDHYDASRGVSFVTYAMHAVKGEMKQGLGHAVYEGANIISGKPSTGGMTLDPGEKKGAAERPVLGLEVGGRAAAGLSGAAVTYDDMDSAHEAAVEELSPEEKKEITDFEQGAQVAEGEEAEHWKQAPAEEEGVHTPEEIAGYIESFKQQVKGKDVEAIQHLSSMSESERQGVFQRMPFMEPVYEHYMGKMGKALSILSKAYEDEQQPQQQPPDAQYVARVGEPGANQFLYEAGGNIVQGTNAPEGHDDHDPVLGSPQVDPGEPTPETAPQLFDEQGRKLHKPIPEGVEAEDNPDYDADSDSGIQWAKKYQDPETGEDSHVYLHRDVALNPKTRHHMTNRYVDAQLPQIRSWYRDLMASGDPTERAMGLFVALLDQAKVKGYGGLDKLTVGNVQVGNGSAVKLNLGDGHTVSVTLDDQANQILQELTGGKGPDDLVFDGFQFSELARAMKDQFGILPADIRKYHGTEMYSKEFQKLHEEGEDPDNIHEQATAKVSKLMGHSDPKAAEDHVDPIASESLQMLTKAREAIDAKVEDSIRSLLKKNPKPDDHQVHALAERLGMEPDDLEEKIYSMLGQRLGKAKDLIPGGLADKKTDKDFDPEQLKAGQKVEMEHTNDPKLAREIARDHLTEDPQYYRKLKKIEKAAQEGWAMESKHPLQGKVRFQGLDISIENKKGSTRHWYDPHGKESGSTKMNYDYGYIGRTKGTDGEHVDVYVGPNEKATHAYVIHQMKKPDFKQFDEDKVMLGFGSVKEAKEAYLKQYNDPRFYGTMSKMPMDEFKQKILDRKNQGKMLKAVISIPHHKDDEVLVTDKEGTALHLHEDGTIKHPKTGETHGTYSWASHEGRPFLEARPKSEGSVYEAGSGEKAPKGMKPHYPPEHMVKGWLPGAGHIPTPTTPTQRRSLRQDAAHALTVHHEHKAYGDHEEAKKWEDHAHRLSQLAGGGPTKKMMQKRADAAGKDVEKERASYESRIRQHGKPGGYDPYRGFSERAVVRHRAASQAMTHPLVGKKFEGESMHLSVTWHVSSDPQERTNDEESFSAWLHNHPLHEHDKHWDAHKKHQAEKKEKERAKKEWDDHVGLGTLKAPSEDFDSIKAAS